MAGEEFLDPREKTATGQGDGHRLPGAIVGGGQRSRERFAVIGEAPADKGDDGPRGTGSLGDQTGRLGHVDDLSESEREQLGRR